MDQALDGVPLGEDIDRDERSFALHPAGLHARRRQKTRHRLGRRFRERPTRATISPISSPTICSTGCRFRAPVGCCWITSISAGACAELESGFRRRAAYAAGGRHAGPDDGLHALDRAAICARIASSAAWTSTSTAAPLHVLFRHLDQLLRGDRQIPRRRGVSGRGWPANGSARKIRLPGVSNFMARPPASISRASSRSTTLRA